MVTTVGKSPHLVKVDMSKMNGCKHVDINNTSQYLALIYGSYYAGTFSTQWYGWNFSPWGTSGIQLDGIQSLWEIRDL